MPYAGDPYSSAPYGGVFAAASGPLTGACTNTLTLTNTLVGGISISRASPTASLSRTSWRATWRAGVTVEISLTTPFGVPTWFDVTSDCREFNITAGRQHALDRMETGTFSGTFDNRGGLYNPWYFNDGTGMGTGQSAIWPVQIPLRVRAVWNSARYDVFWGLIDSVIPSTPDELNSETTITASDLLKYLSNTYISSNYYYNLVKADTPLAYYRLGEAQGASNVIHDMSGNGYNGRIGGRVTFGASGELLYDTDTACDLANSTITPGGYLVMPAALTSAVGTSWSVECWVATNEAVETACVVLGNLSNATYWQLVAFPGTPSPGVLENFTIGFSGGTFNFTSGNTQCNVLDGNWHHIVLTQCACGGNTTTILYVDGAHIQTTTQATTSPQNFWSSGAQFTVGLSQAGSTPQPSFPGIVDEVAVYNSVLSSGTVAAHFDAGQWFYNADYSGTRIAQTLTVIGVPPSNWGGSAGEAGGTIATGRVQIASAQDGVAAAGGTPLGLTDQSALDYIQTVETTENGSFYQLPNGALAFRDQYYVYTNSTSNTSQITFADELDSDYPCHYKPGIQIVLDDQDIWNVIQVQPVTGIEQTVYNQGSIDQFGYRLQQDLSGVLAGTQQQAANLAGLLLLQYSYPLIRIGSMSSGSTINQGAAMPYLLGLYLLDSFSVKRTAQVSVPTLSAYPQASGYTSPDIVANPPTPDYSTEPGRFVVESIVHKVIPGSNAFSDTFSWTTTWVGSPHELQGAILFLRLGTSSTDQLDTWGVAP